MTLQTNSEPPICPGCGKPLTEDLETYTGPVRKYHNNACRQRAYRQRKKGAPLRKHAAPGKRWHRPEPATCLNCGKPLPEYAPYGQPEKYCNHACQKQAQRRQKKKKKHAAKKTYTSEAQRDE